MKQIIIILLFSNICFSQGASWETNRRLQENVPEGSFFKMGANGTFEAVDSMCVTGIDYSNYNSSANSTTSYKAFINETTNTISAGEYTVEVSFVYAHNSTTSSMRTRLNINEELAQNNYDQQTEPKDAAGSNTVVTDGVSQNAGSNEKIATSYIRNYTLPTDGTINIVFEFRPEVSGILSTMFNATIKIKKKI